MNHITIFNELSTGKLKKLLTGKCLHDDVLSLVQSVNSKVIYKNILSSEVSNYIENFDFQAHGYDALEDFTHSIIACNSPSHVNISISPSCFYSLQDDFTLLQAPDKRSNLLLQLFCDEFERIKKRAQYFFATTCDSEQLKVYAIKNLQFVKSCFHVCKSVFHKLFTKYPAYMLQPDAFIYFYLNFFLIRVRLFYEKFFEHFVPKSKKTEKQLLAELFQYDSSSINKGINNSYDYSLNLPACSVAENEPEFYTKKNVKIQQSFDSSTSLDQAIALIAKEYKLTFDDLKGLLEQVGQSQWLKNSNILADYFSQLMYSNKENGVSPLRTNAACLALIVSVFCKDKKGHRISRSTFTTYLQKSRDDKRPKDESGNRIIAILPTEVD